MDSGFALTMTFLLFVFRDFLPGRHLEWEGLFGMRKEDLVDIPLNNPYNRSGMEKTASETQSFFVSGERPFLPLLVLLFAGSGCAALIYEVVWLQMLSLIIGSSAISVGILLGTYMGGLCAGSLLLACLVSRRRHPLRVYTLLEAGIGIFGVTVYLILPLAGNLYTTMAAHGIGGLVLRGLFCALCLIPPTLLMGATLPAISRWIEATPQGTSWLGFFYAGNIAGAVLGCLLAGYYLLRLYDVATATVVAVLINAGVALAAGILSLSAVHRESTPQAPCKVSVYSSANWSIYITIGLSGLTALGSEVIWTNLLSLNLGGTTYTFSLILAVFLLGLGIGSSLGAAITSRVTDSRIWLGGCQFLLVGCMTWAAYVLTQALPYWPINQVLSVSSTFTFPVDLLKTFFTVFPAALLWGASFPLALAAGGSRQSDPGEVVGSIYAADTVGAILGSLLTSLVLIPRLGTRYSQQLLMGLAALAGLLMLARYLKKEGVSLWRIVWRSSALVTLILICLALAGTVVSVPPLLVGYGRNASRWLNFNQEFIYVGEGTNSSMAVSRLPSGVLHYHNAGKIQASSESRDMRLQRMLGHLATLLPKQAPRSVLVIGCGAGVTAGSVSIDPGVEREVIVEIEPLVPQVVSRFFSKHNFDVVRNPKVQITIDDGRHYLLTTNAKFDAITSDPFDPWVKGAANLYTKEFFKLVLERLNPGGVVTVFVQLYESNTEAVKSEVGTFLQVFPEGLIFGNTSEGEGYDMVLVGQATPEPIDVAAIQERLARREYALVSRSLLEIGMRSTTDLLSTFAVKGKDLQPWLVDMQINLDRNLRLQYLAGFGLNQYEQARIYEEIMKYRRFPEGLFKASPEQLVKLRVHNWQ